MTIPNNGHRIIYGQRIEWHTGCPMCPALHTCQHDCSHPGWMQLWNTDSIPQWRISGKLTPERVVAELEMIVEAGIEQLALDTQEE